ncbi:MAG: V8-like Glu-specific endopeptidase [Acidobacteria bacterium]|nr:V8-like Glu-specific endopeptidase [Acidobacteriota bacterium]
MPVPAVATALREAASRVCRIVFDRGTRRERTGACGFLVAGDLVMTSAHVWPSVLAGTTSRESVALVFEDGASTSLHTDWLAVHSPRGLDVAVVRIASPHGVSRGWITFPQHPPVLAAEMIVAVVQFPSRLAPPSLSLGAVRRVEADRIVYSAPTVRGSSGAPVFDAAMRLIAVHRGGGNEGNEGVVVRAVGC